MAEPGGSQGFNWHDVPIVDWFLPDPEPSKGVALEDLPGVDWSGWSLKDKIAWTSQGSGAQAIDSTHGALDNLGGRFRDSDGEVRRQLGEMQVGWQGRAAGSATAAMTQVAAAGGASGEASAQGTVPVGTYGHSFDGLKNKFTYHEGPLSSALGDWAPAAQSVLPAPILAGAGVTDEMAKVVMNASEGKRADHLLQAHESAARVAVQAFPASAPSPGLPGGPAAPGGDGSAGVGGGIGAGGGSGAPGGGGAPSAAPVTPAPAAPDGGSPTPAAPPVAKGPGTDGNGAGNGGNGNGGGNGAGRTDAPRANDAPAAQDAPGNGNGVGGDDGRGGSDRTTAPPTLAQAEVTAPPAGTGAPNVTPPASPTAPSSPITPAPGAPTTAFPGYLPGTVPPSGSNGGIGRTPSLPLPRSGSDFGSNLLRNQPGRVPGAGGTGAWGAEPSPRAGGPGTGWGGSGSGGGSGGSGSGGSGSGGSGSGGTGQGGPGRYGGAGVSETVPGRGVSEPAPGRSGTGANGVTPMGGMGAGGRGSDQDHRNRYLLPSSEAFDLDLQATPPVLGAEPDEEYDR